MREISFPSLEGGLLVRGNVRRFGKNEGVESTRTSTKKLGVGHQNSKTYISTVTVYLEEIGNS